MNINQNQSNKDVVNTIKKTHDISINQSRIHTWEVSYNYVTCLSILIIHLVFNILISRNFVTNSDQIINENFWKRSGYIIIFIVFVANIYVIFELQMHTVNVMSVVSDSKKDKLFDTKTLEKYEKKASQLHHRHLKYMGFMRKIFNGTLLLLLIAMPLLLIGSHPKGMILENILLWVLPGIVLAIIFYRHVLTNQYKITIH